MRSKPAGNDLAELIIGELLEGRSFKYQKWMEKRFASLKFASASEKGDVGEDFLGAMLKGMGYRDVEVVPTRRGEYDVRVSNGGEEIKFEVKTATRDVHESFQFNGIRYDTRYTHLFLFGISPEALCYEIVPKGKLNSAGYTMVPMQKGANSTFKVTRREKDLRNFDDFSAEVRDLLGAPQK